MRVLDVGVGPGWAALDLADVVGADGRAVLHEYAGYGSWSFAPPRPALRAFVGEVMASWRASGGEPDVLP